MLRCCISIYNSGKGSTVVRSCILLQDCQENQGVKLRLGRPKRLNVLNNDLFVFDLANLAKGNVTLHYKLFSPELSSNLMSQLAPLPAHSCPMLCKELTSYVSVSC